MDDLPRGHDARSIEAPIATARWANPDEIARTAYRDGDIWLGMLPVPHADAADTLDRLHAFCAALAVDEDESNFSSHARD